MAAKTGINCLTFDGVHTTIPCYQAVLAHPDFGKGQITTRWVEESLMKQGFEKERAA